MQHVEKKVEKSLAKPPRALLNLEDYHQRAKEKLPQMIYDFYSGGADDQLTLIDNEQDFRRIKLRPKILIDVSSHSTVNSISCQIKVLNSAITISFPCIIAPTALHRLANSEHGELATVRAAVACSTIMCVSTTACSDNTDINSTQSPSKIKNVVERCSSPIPGKTDSSIAICTERRLSPLSSSWCTVSTNDQTSSTDILYSSSSQHSNVVDSTTKTSSSLLQQSTPSQSKQTNVSVKKVDSAQTPKDSKRRSYALRSKAKIKPQTPTEHTDTAPLAPPSKKRKIDSNKKSAENYQTLTKQLGKIPKKTHTSSATVTSNDN